MKDFFFRCDDCGSTCDSTCRGRCRCGSPLDMEWNAGAIQQDGRNWLERYGSFFPFDEEEWIDGGALCTPALDMKRLAQELDLAHLWVKNETANLTWSFKDRGTAACVAHARALGIQRIGTVSTGNMAASVAAFGAVAGLETFVLVKGDMAEEKMAPVALYGSRLLRVDGPYDELYNESLRLGEKLGIYFMNSDMALRVAGSRTISFELCEQCGSIDWVVVPVSAGGNFRGIVQGFRDFKRRGFIDVMPRFLCAQASGCAPIVKAFDSNDYYVEPFGVTNTIAHAIENPFPPSGNRVLKLLRETKGVALSVPDDAILSAQANLARCGLFVQPASAVPLAALRLARRRGIVAPGSRVVLIATGSGLKYTASLARHQVAWQDCHLDNLAEFLTEPVLP